MKCKHCSGSGYRIATGQVLECQDCHGSGIWIDNNSPFSFTRTFDAECQRIWEQREASFIKDLVKSIFPPRPFSDPLPNFVFPDKAKWHDSNMLHVAESIRPLQVRSTSVFDAPPRAYSKQDNVGAIADIIAAIRKCKARGDNTPRLNPHLLIAENLPLRRSELPPLVLSNVQKHLLTYGMSAEKFKTEILGLPTDKKPKKKVHPRTGNIYWEPYQEPPAGTPPEKYIDLPLPEAKII